MASYKFINKIILGGSLHLLQTYIYINTGVSIEHDYLPHAKMHLAIIVIIVNFRILNKTYSYVSIQRNYKICLIFYHY